MRVLDRGGNAVDAGVTASMALSVLQPDMVSFACVAPTLIYMNRGDHYASGYAVDVQPPGAVDPVELPDNRCARKSASSTLV